MHRLFFLNLLFWSCALSAFNFNNEGVTAASGSVTWNQLIQNQKQIVNLQEQIDALHHAYMMTAMVGVATLIYVKYSCSKARKDKEVDQ